MSQVVKEKKWPSTIIVKNTQIEHLCRLTGWEIPVGGLTFEKIPYPENAWHVKWENYGDLNGRKIVHRGVVFLCYIKKIKNVPFAAQEITNKLLLDFFEWLKKSKLINSRSIFQWAYAVESMVLEALDLNLKEIAGYAKVTKLLKKIEAFAGEPKSVDPYTPKFFAKLFNHPEEGDDLPKKMFLLSSCVSPVRLKFFDSMNFSSMTHDPERKMLVFFKDDTKTGQGKFTVTDYRRNPHFSLYRMFKKYIGMIQPKYRKGGFWRYFTESKFAGQKGFYSPGKRWKMQDFVLVRKEMEARYLETFPADVILEEVTGQPLSRESRFSNLNENTGLTRYGVKSFRKTYASGNATNPNLTDEQSSRGYWKSVQVFRNSYMRNSATETFRQEKVIRHLLNLAGGTSSDESDLLKVLVFQNQMMLQMMVRRDFGDEGEYFTSNGTVLGKRKSDNSLGNVEKKRKLDNEVFVPSNLDNIMEENVEKKKIQGGQEPGHTVSQKAFNRSQEAMILDQSKGHRLYGQYKAPVVSSDTFSRATVVRTPSGDLVPEDALEQVKILDEEFENILLDDDEEEEEDDDEEEEDDDEDDEVDDLSWLDDIPVLD